MPSPITPSKKRVLASKKIDTGSPVAIAAHTAPDTSKWLTRNEASDLLACSPGTLLNYERRGVLHPGYVYRADGRGAQQRLVVYNPDELTKLASRMKRGSARGSARDPGEVAALAVELFSEGKTNAEVIVALRATFEQVDELRQKWIDATGAAFVISSVAKKALEDAVGPFTDVAELVTLVTTKLAAHPRAPTSFGKSRRLQNVKTSPVQRSTT
jgi:hypothetical protein